MTPPASRRVLIVDDDADCAGELAELIETCDFTASIATCLADARRIFAEARPDVAIVDVWVGSERGVELVREWLDGAAPHPRVIFLTGDASAADELASLGENPPPMLLKPVDVSRLVALIEAQGHGSGR